MKSPHEFYLETNGKIIDMDGQHGGQCWDLFALFTQEYCNYIFPCVFTGYVKDYYYHFKELHLDLYFDLITDRHKLQDGDWLIWDYETNPKYCWITRSSHIGMFRKYESNPEQNTILHQTPNSNPICTHQQIADFLGFVGALRPKCYIQNQVVETKVDETPKEEKNLTNNEKHDSIETNQDNNIANEKENVIYWLFELIAKFVVKILKRKE